MELLRRRRESLGTRLELDTYPLSKLICPRCAKLNLVEVSQCSLCILAQQNRHIMFLALVALKLLVLLISRLVACSARIVVDKHTQTHRHTELLL